MHHDPRRLRQPRGILQGHELDQIDIAGQQGGTAGAVAGQDAELHPLPIRLLAPVALEAPQLDALLALHLDHLVRPGADRRAALVQVFRRASFHRLLRQDGQLGDLRRQQWKETSRDDIDRVVVHLPDLGHAQQLPTIGRGVVGHVRHALEAEHHIIRGEGRAVVEGHALPQVEAPGVLAIRRPGGRQIRAQLAMLVGIGECTVDVLVVGDVRIEQQEVRIERGDVLRPDPQVRGLRGNGRCPGQRPEGQEHGETDRARCHARIPLGDGHQSRVRPPRVSSDYAYPIHAFRL